MQLYAMRSDDIHPGDVIGGKYRVRAILSRIPTLTLEAFHVEFDQRVVIKLLLAGTGDDREIERFRREARVLSKLESEHAARILDVGTQADGSFYLVRQHVEGEDLASYVHNYGPRPLPEAVLLALQAAECVAETHTHGIVVRELSPQNMVVARRPSGTPLLKLTDFGTAKLMRDASAPAGGSSLTATALFGLSSYSSPELVRKAKNVDARADVWSLGAVLYFLLAGKPPFSGDVARLMLAITREDPPAITSLRGDVVPDIDNIISWALAKDIDRRFKNVHSFAHSLSPYAPTEGQLLIERIAQIAHRAKQRKSGAVPPPPPSYVPPPPSRSSVIPAPISRPIAISNAEFADMPGDEEATQVLGGASGSGSNLPLLAKELMSGRGSSPDLPRAPESISPAPMAFSTRGLPVPPPPPSLPPSPFLGAGKLAAPPRARAQDAAPDTHPPLVQPSISPKPLDKRASSGFDIRILWGALAATAVMLPVVLLLLLRDQPKPTADAPVRPLDPNPITIPDRPAAATPPPAVATAPERPSIQLSAQPDEPPAAVVVETDPPANGRQPPPRPTGRPEPKPKQPEPKQPEPKQPEPKQPEPKQPEPAATGGSGRLLAIATGGSCSFSVDGASKGSGSSLSVSLPAGKHTVVCKPTSGAAKSRGATIKPNETTMLTFKF
jgi:serine/threonine-protein kinase